MDLKVVLLLGLLVMFSLQCLKLRFAGYRIALFLDTISACGSIVVACAVYCIQKVGIIVAAVKKATHLEVLRYIYCFVIVLTCCMDVARIITKAHGGRGFTYYLLTLVANIFVELLGGWVNF